MDSHSRHTLIKPNEGKNDISHFNFDRICLADLEDTRDRLYNSGLVYHTPVISRIEHVLRLESRGYKNLSLKLESMQNQGSFKIRGTVNQFLNLEKPKSRPLVTMSAGNYGKAFCYVAKYFGSAATVFMPQTAPAIRKEIMEGLGATVYQCPTENLTAMVNDHEKSHQSIFFHSFDDPILITGHASAGLEVIEDLKTAPDIVVVCCGGGGFIAGVTLAFLRKRLDHTKIYGVEPEHAPSMYLSFQKQTSTSITPKPTIAAGLAPPFAGENSYQLIKDRVSDIILVSEEELSLAVSMLFTAGLVVEPSGAAAVAALIANKVPDTEGKNILAFITGGNTTPSELGKFVKLPGTT